MKRSGFAKSLAKAWVKRLLGADKSDPMVTPFFDQKVLYVPIPKAANTSIKHALCSVLLDQDVSDSPNIHRDERVPKVAFSAISDRIDDDWFVFTVVRNPFGRSMSAYRDKVVKDRCRINGVRELGIEPGDSYLRLLRNARFWPRRMLNNHFIPQSLLLTGPMRLPNLRIFKYEALGDAWAEIADTVAERAGGARMDLAVRNATGAAADDTGAAERTIIRALYAEDFRVLNYPVD